MPFRTRSPIRLWQLCLLLAALAGCASPQNRAPVEERGANAPRPGAAGTTASAPAPAAAPTEAAKPPPPGIENAGKPGYYSVKPGDTLIRIALENGQNWREIVRWNNLENPNLIEVGQVLRVVPPTVDASAATTRPVTTARVEARPLDSAKPPAASSPAAAASAPAPAPSPAASTARDDEELSWSWPTAGTVVAGFDEGRNKGLVFGGKAGDPVLAAADGRVVYAGSGLRGYGNLVIVKHNSVYLTAYAHNQTLLVKEDQAVRRGQKIAEMGATESERVQLHFEIRRQGKPVDPARLLPAR